jgi:hypothetical protein
MARASVSRGSVASMRLDLGATGSPEPVPAQTRPARTGSGEPVAPYAVNPFQGQTEAYDATRGYGLAVDFWMPLVVPDQCPGQASDGGLSSGVARADPSLTPSSRGPLCARDDRDVNRRHWSGTTSGTPDFGILATTSCHIKTSSFHGAKGLTASRGTQRLAKNVEVARRAASRLLTSAQVNSGTFSA